MSGAIFTSIFSNLLLGARLPSTSSRRLLLGCFPREESEFDEESELELVLLATELWEERDEAEEERLRFES